MSVVGQKAIADLRAKRLQTSVVAIVALLASVAATLALNLLVESDAPYDHAFEQAKGPHLAMTFDGSRVSRSQLQQTARLSAVTGSNGPWQLTTTRMTVVPSGRPSRSVEAANVVLRPGIDGVDTLTVIDGRWATSAGEIVLSRTLADSSNGRPGDTAIFPDLPNSPQFSVVGVAASISPIAGAWVPPQASEVLIPGDRNPNWLMEYRVRNPHDAVSVKAVADSIDKYLSKGSVQSSLSWLDIKKQADLTAAVMVPFLLAFSALALLAGAFVVSNVVFGIVIAGRRQVGVMKAIGFTPCQVVLIVMAQVLVPTAAGSILGIGIGSLASQPFLADTAHALGLPAPFLASVQVDLGVLAGVLAIATLAAAAPAMQAGRLDVISAITTGYGPSSPRGVGIGRWLSRVSLPVPLRLGLADSATRPVRTLMTALAILIGTATVVFAVSLSLSLDQVYEHIVRQGQVQVRLHVPPNGSAARISELIKARPDIARSVGENTIFVEVSGMGTPIPFYGYDGDSSWLGYALISGQWATKPGDVIAPSHLLDLTGLKIGQNFNAVSSGRSETLRLVGEVFDETGDNLLLRGPIVFPAPVTSYEVQLTQGTYPEAFAQSLFMSGPGSVGVELTAGSGPYTSFLLIKGIVFGLAAILTAIAIAAVLNSVYLRTNERRREVGILKSIGMSPDQVVAMIVSGSAVLGLLAGLAGVPAGSLIHGQILTFMGAIANDTRVPVAFYYPVPALVLAMLALSGSVIAAIGSWLPARWTASTSPASVIQAE